MFRNHPLIFCSRKSYHQKHIEKLERTTITGPFQTQMPAERWAVQVRCSHFFNQSNRHIPQISSCHLAIFGIAFVFCRSRLKSRSIKIYNQTPRGTCNNICTTTYCIVLYAHGCLKPSLAICSANLRSPFLYQQFCFYFKGMFLNGTYDTYNYVLLRLKLLITACFNTLYPHFQQSARIKGGSHPSPFLHLSSEKVPHSHGMVWVFS